ncbi:MAG: DNA repair protein RecO, partial [Elusimicrobia bacterium]|nr:DNA repair protein RecO [Elusimicrobiota bacterium]
MIFSDKAIVLLKKDHRETDRVVSIYTQSRGRMLIRFPGVNRSRGKLKIFTEPFACAEFRIYLRQNSPVGCGAGGKIITVFPNLRRDLEKTKMAFYFCELMFKLTPEHQPSPEKYKLLFDGLNRLENAQLYPALGTAYGLRLMELAGFGLDKPVLGISRELWQKLHDEPFAQITFNETQEEDLRKADYVVRRFIISHFNAPL